MFASSATGPPVVYAGLLLTNVSPGPLNVTRLVGLRLVALVAGTACGTVAVELSVVDRGDSAAAVGGRAVSGSLARLAAAPAPVAAHGYRSAVPAWQPIADGSAAPDSVPSTIAWPAPRNGHPTVQQPTVAMGGALPVHDVGGSLDVWAATSSQAPGRFEVAVAPLDLPLHHVAAATGLDAGDIRAGLAASTMAHVALPLRVSWAAPVDAAHGACDVAALGAAVADAFPQVAGGARLETGPISRPTVLPSCLRDVNGSSPAACVPAHVHAVSGVALVSLLRQPPVVLRVAAALRDGSSYELAPWVRAAPSPAVSTCAPAASASAPPAGATVAAAAANADAVTVQVRVVAVAPGGIVLALALGLVLLCAAAELCCWCCTRVYGQRAPRAGGRNPGRHKAGSGGGRSPSPLAVHDAPDAAAHALQSPLHAGATSAPTPPPVGRWARHRPSTSPAGTGDGAGSVQRAPPPGGVHHATTASTNPMLLQGYRSSVLLGASQDRGARKSR